MGGWVEKGKSEKGGGRRRDRIGKLTQREREEEGRSSGLPLARSLAESRCRR